MSRLLLRRSLGGAQYDPMQHALDWRHLGSSGELLGGPAVAGCVSSAGAAAEGRMTLQTGMPACEVRDQADCVTQNPSAEWPLRSAADSRCGEGHVSGISETASLSRPGGRSAPKVRSAPVRSGTVGKSWQRFAATSDPGPRERVQRGRGIHFERTERGGVPGVLGVTATGRSPTAM